MPWGVAAGALGGALISAYGANQAANTQANADNQASQIQQNMFNTIRGQEQPYINSGYSTLGELMNGFGAPSGSSGTSGGYPTSSGSYPGNGYTATPSGGIQQLMTNSPSSNGVSYTGSSMVNPKVGSMGQVGVGGNSIQPRTAIGTTPTVNAPTSSGGIPTGYFNETFNPSSMASDPAYQFALKQGNQNITNGSAPTVGALSGANQKALTSFDVGTTNQWENQYYNQFVNNQNSIFSRLSAIAGLGQNAATQTGNNGAQLGSGIAQSTAAAGAAQAGLAMVVI